MKNKKWQAILVFYFVAASLCGLVVWPPSWNTAYYEARIKANNKHGKDSIAAVQFPTYDLIPHSYFPFGNSAYKKYKRHDTVPVFRNGEMVGEIKLAGWNSEMKVVWIRP